MKLLISIKYFYWNFQNIDANIYILLIKINPNGIMDETQLTSLLFL